MAFGDLKKFVSYNQHRVHVSGSAIDPYLQQYFSYKIACRILEVALEMKENWSHINPTK